MLGRTQARPQISTDNRPMAVRFSIVLAGTALALAAMPGTAQAACSVNNPGLTDYLCVGSFSSFSMLPSATATFALNGATITNGAIFGGNTGANVSVSINSASSITSAGGDGLVITTNKASITTTTPGGIGINGAIKAFGNGVAISTSGNGGDVSFLTGTTGTITAGQMGIAIFTGFDSKVTLTTNGTVTSTNATGIGTRTVDGFNSVSANAAVTAAVTGISASASGTGGVYVGGSGAITGTQGSGISASAGVGGVTIAPTGKVSGATGISAYAGSSGNLTVSTGNTVTGTQFGAIETTATDGLTNITVGGGGATGASGVKATATGLGAIQLQVKGNITGTQSYGVRTATTTGDTIIDIDAGTFIAGKSEAVRVQSLTGNGFITNRGTIGGGSLSTAIVSDLGTGTMNISNSGTIKSIGTNAIANVSGNMAISNSGLIDGAIIGNGITDVANSGTWQNAANSTVATLTNTGTLTMGASGSGAGAIGTLVVTGNASFGPQSFYNARITPTGTSDQLVVGGTLTIEGGTLNISGASGTYVPGKTYTMISAIGGITGRFGTVSSSLDSVVGVAGYDGNNVTLVLLNRDFRAAALTRNQYNVASAIYRGSASLNAGAGADLLTALTNTPAAGLPAALNQMTGDGLTGAKNLNLRAGQMFSSVLTDQQTFWRSGEKRDLNGITSQEQPNYYAPVQTNAKAWPVSRQQYMKAPIVRPEPPRTWRVWFSGFAGSQSIAGNDVTGSASQTNRAIGGALGIDYQLGQNLLVGVAGGYSDGSFAAAARSTSGTAKGLHGAVYGGMRVGPFYSSASFAYSGFSNETVRNNAGFGGALPETEKANYGSREVRSRLEIGRKIDAGVMAITPFAAVEVARIHTDPFVETSRTITGLPGMLGLAYASQGTSSVPTYLGGRIETRIAYGEVSLVPWASVAWAHEFASRRDQTGYLSALPGASFSTSGARPSRDSLQVKAGAQLEITRYAALYATFEGEFLAKNPVYTGKGGLKVGW